MHLLSDTIIIDSLDQLRLRLPGLTNQNLLEEFETVFKGIGNVLPTSEEERWDMIDICRCYTNEFIKRLQYASPSAINSLGEIVKIRLKYDPVGGNSFYTRNLTLLLEQCRKAFKKRGATNDQIRRDYL